ncbi:VOC family protein [Metabacillus fastidiosus]|uniref:VOC family protein n=1 Tax=Metabacillus fastidiosus TaxID=1458 RepID=UPI002E232B3A|nr:VOC family protein [Metabacillus fastidiosus]
MSSFEIQVDDMGRAKKFYREVFGGRFEDSSNYIWHSSARSEHKVECLHNSIDI